MFLSIVIPAFNEEKRILRALDDYYSFFGKRVEFELIVVCDGVTDATEAIVNGFAKSHKQVRLLSFPNRLGKGGAVEKGVLASCGEVVGFVDADDSVVARDFFLMVNVLAEESVDCVIASRHLPESKVLAGQPLSRRVAGRGFNFLVRSLFNLPFRDTQCGAKVFRREAVLSVLPLHSKGFEFDVELLWRLKGKGFKIREFPVEWRHLGGSKTSFKFVPGMLSGIISLKLKELK